MASRSRRTTEQPTEREKLLKAARVAAGCQYIRRYGLTPDLSYLDKESEERLRTIVRNWFRTDDLDAILAPGPFFVA